MEVLFFALLLLVLATVALGIASRKFPPTGDEPHYLTATHSLAVDGDLSLLNNYQEQQYRLFYPAPLAKRTSPSGDRKTELPAFGPGLPFLLAPFYKLALAVFPGLLVPFLRWILSLIAILSLFLLFRLVSPLIRHSVTGLIAIGSAALSSPLITYSNQFYPELPAFFLLTLALWSILESSKRSRSALFLLAIIPAALLWLHPKYLILAFVLLGYSFYLFYKMKANRPLAFLYLILSLTAILTFFVFLYISYGSLSPNRIYEGWERERSVLDLLRQEGLRRIGVMIKMFFGYWIDQRFGLLIFAPFYIAFFPSLFWLRKANSFLFVPILLLFGFHFVGLCWAAPMGGYAPPSRHMVVLLPLFLIPISLACEFWNPLQRFLFFLLVFCSIVIALLMLSNYRSLFVNLSWNNPDIISPFWDHLGLASFLPRFTMTEPPYLLMGSWILLVGVLSCVLYPRQRPNGPEETKLERQETVC